MKHKKIGRQAGLIPFREVGGQIEILLATSRDTGRWVIPKGNIGARLTPAEAAIREGYEEAGIKGTILSETPIGSYDYLKRLSNGRITPVTVEVYPFQVQEQLRKWPEKRQRRTRWFLSRDAATLVDETELSALILRFEAARDQDGDRLGSDRGRGSECPDEIKDTE